MLIINSDRMPKFLHPGVGLRVASAIALASSVILSACTAASPGDEAELTRNLAECMVNGAEPVRLQALGEMSATKGTANWRRGDALGCTGFFRYASSEDFRKVVEISADTLLLQHAKFRDGMYSGIGIPLSVPAVQREKLSQIGRTVERGVIAADVIRNCNVVPGFTSEYLDSVAYTFTLASVGVQLPGLSDERVYDVTESLIRGIAVVAPAVAQTAGCSDTESSLKDLALFVDEMSAFRRGDHSLSAGCSADMTLDQLHLKCGGKPVSLKQHKK